MGKRGNGAGGHQKHGKGKSRAGGGPGGAHNMNKKKKSKLVITFDAEKRKEYLTGFHKRKQERRRFGLDMEAYKQKKKQLELRKEKRAEQKQLLKDLKLDSDNEEDEEEEKEEDDEELQQFLDEEGDVSETEQPKNGTVTKVMKFDDEHTQQKFGDVVTVTTSIGDIPSDSEDEVSDPELDDEEDEEEQEEHEDKQAHNKNSKDKWTNHSMGGHEKQLTLFQRIQLKRKGLALPSKRAKLKQANQSRKAMGIKTKGKHKGKHMKASASAAGATEERKPAKFKHTPGKSGKHGNKRYKKH